MALTWWFSYSKNKIITRYRNLKKKKVRCQCVELWGHCIPFHLRYSYNYFILWVLIVVYSGQDPGNFHYVIPVVLKTWWNTGMFRILVFTKWTLLASTPQQVCEPWGGVGGSRCPRGPLCQCREGRPWGSSWPWCPVARCDRLCFPFSKAWCFLTFSFLSFVVCVVFIFIFPFIIMEMHHSGVLITVWCSLTFYLMLFSTSEKNRPG